MTSGIVISLYNMIDVKKIYDSIDIPIIGVTYSDSGSLDEIIKKHFPDNCEEKLAQYKKIGNREKVSLNVTDKISPTFFALLSEENNPEELVL